MRVKNKDDFLDKHHIKFLAQLLYFKLLVLIQYNKIFVVIEINCITK